MTDLKLVIVDLDDTLIRSTALTRTALTTIACRLDVRVDTETLLARFGEQDTDAFARMAQGEITVAHYRAHRFDWLVPARSARAELIDHCNAVFMGICNNPDSGDVMTGAVETLIALRNRRIDVAVLSNGPADGQRSKLRTSGVGALVDYVQISGEAGLAKPDPRAFRRVLDQFEVTDTAAVVMIGDSPRNDLAPASSLGIGTCHFTSEFLPDGTARWAHLRSTLLEG